AIGSIRLDVKPVRTLGGPRAITHAESLNGSRGAYPALPRLHNSYADHSIRDLVMALGLANLNEIWRCYGRLPTVDQFPGPPRSGRKAGLERQFPAAIQQLIRHLDASLIDHHGRLRVDCHGDVEIDDLPGVRDSKHFLQGKCRILRSSDRRTT